MSVTVERDSIINMAVALIRRETSFELKLNKMTGGIVVSGTFESDEDMREAEREVRELRRKRGQV